MAVLRLSEGVPSLLGNHQGVCRKSWRAPMDACRVVILNVGRLALVAGGVGTTWGPNDRRANSRPARFGT